ncbi:MAG: hypothetical protein WCD76_02960, partial [Pyrinomonadaceae bacterium]
PQPAPAPDPAPDPDKERKRRGDCPKNTVPINWPFPVWKIAGRQDSGALSSANNHPPRVLTKIESPERNRTIIGEYVRDNWAALKPYYENGTMGAIHHKWPLYLGGPDSKENFVFLTFAEHTAWHGALTSQTLGQRGTVYCIVRYLG